MLDSLTKVRQVVPSSGGCTVGQASVSPSVGQGVDSTGPVAGGVARVASVGGREAVPTVVAITIAITIAIAIGGPVARTKPGAVAELEVLLQQLLTLCVCGNGHDS